MTYFSVVIPSHNRLSMLLRVVDSLREQRDAPPFETIVVDDGSTDGTADVVSQRSDITFRSQKNSGPGKARNEGVKLARGRFVIFMGDDTVPDARFLAEHHRIHRDSNDDPLVACLGYTGWPEGDRVTAFMDYINDFGLQFGYKLIRDGEIVPFNFFYTSNISIDRQLLADHPFDTTFPSAAWEDIELAYRLDRKGLKIRYNQRAKTKHHHPMTVDSFARRQYTVGKSGAIFYSKHPELGHFLGVHELETRPLADEKQLTRLRRRARLGERFRFLAQPKVFETLMREHYLRGLRDGLEAVSGLRFSVSPQTVDRRRMGDLPFVEKLKIAGLTPRFITFEGPEGSGKTTQIQKVATLLRERNIECVVTKEPGGTPLADRIRAILLHSENTMDRLTELLLYAASRRQHVLEVIKPSLHRGLIVLCDRYTDAGLAYQGFGRLLDLDRLRSLNDWVTDSLRPDLTILYDIDEETGLRRARSRNARATHDEGRFEAEDVRFHRRVREGYLALANAEPQRFVIVDGSGTVDEVFARTVDVLEKREVIR